MLKRIKHLSDSAKTHQGFRRYFANTSWMFAEQIMRMVAGLLVGIWVARYLGPAQFGVFSYAVAFTALFSSIAKLGLDSIIVRDLVRDPSQRDLYMGTAFWLKVSGAIVMLAVIALTTQLTSNDPTTELYILIIASGVIFQSFEVVDFYFQSKALSKFVSICKLTQLLLSSVLKIYFVLTGAGLFWFVIVSVVDQTTLGVSLYIAYRYQKLGSFFRHFDLITAKKLLKNSWPLMLSGLVIIIYQRIDQIMIKEMLGEKEVGLYSAAVRLSEVWYFIPVIITNSLFPAIINAKQISEEFYYGRLQKLYTLMVWLAIGIALPMTFLSDWLVTLLYGEAYREGGQVLMIYIWAVVFVFFGWAWSQWMIIENRTKTPTFFHINTMLWNVILNLFLIPKFGINGAALSTLISASIGHTILPLFIRSQRIALKMFLYSFIPIYLIKRPPKCKEKLRRIEEMNKSYLLKREQLDLKVMEDVFNNNFMVHNGPFEGMKYIDKSSGSALLPKILGSYEEPIQEWILQTIEKNYETILVIGCAEGYYAVGFGMRMPNAKIIAYDVDQEARIKTGELIKLNGLGNIKIKAECTHADLNAMSKANTLVFCDIEGFEHYLLDPIKAPNLRYVDLIVESHDFIVPNMTEDLITRFYKTHIINIAVDYPFRKNKYKTPNKSSSSIFQEIINEMRPPAMKFLYMESLDGQL